MAGHLAGEVLEGRWLYVEGLGWLRWDGTVWREAGAEALPLRQAIHEYLSRWLAESVASLAPQQLAALVRHLHPSGIDNLVRKVRDFSALTGEVADLDPDPLMVNTPSGVVDLLNGELAPHEPFYRMTRITGAGYRPGATHPDWEKALGALPDEDTRRWLQWYLGGGLVGRQRGAVVPFLQGGGANGKSLIMGAVDAALGTYSGMISDQLLTGNGHEAYRVQLLGLRLALLEELPDGHRLSVATLKQITDTGTIAARRLYQQAMTFRATHSLVVTTNYAPVVTETDHGAWRRLAMVPFPNTYEPDGALKERLHTEPAQQEAVLAWLVEGALMEDEPPISRAMHEATGDWRAGVDLVASFCDEHLEPDPDARVDRKTLLDAYNEHATGLGHKRLTGRTFTERFREHPQAKAWHVAEGRSSSGRHWQGIRLKTYDL
jgi:P4 family phage/plasmid primase-like protien